MLDVMYEVPSNEKICKVIVTIDSIRGKKSPTVVEGPRKMFAPGATPSVSPKKSVESA
jgi:ATP-dependent Clp protease ATP-binding subunit ClpX